MRIVFTQLILLLGTVLASAAWAGDIDFGREDAAPGNMRFTWIHGSISAKANTDVRVQVHRYNEHTYMLRQNLAVHWEAPFMYLLMGNGKALLLDAGATEEADYFPLRKTVDLVLERWRDANASAELELIVMPLGADASQTAALKQFLGRANTRVVQPDSKHRNQFFGQAVSEPITFDLGGRTLHVMATPGLEAQAISVYDTWSDLLFTGNSFYPGRLVVRDFKTYRASLNRLVEFAQAYPVKWVFGGRIEMTARPGMDYLLRTNYRPNEHVLQLHPATLTQAYNVTQLINGQTQIRILDDFIVMHGVGRGARDYGWPVFTPEQLSSARTR